MIIAAHAAYPEVSLRRLCTLFGVNRAWYCRHRRADSVDGDAATRLHDGIARSVLAFPGYGYRRVTKALRCDDEAVNHKRVLRVIRQESLLCLLTWRFVATTDSRHTCRAYPNLLREAVVDRLDRAWLADITYIRLPRCRSRRTATP